MRLLGRYVWLLSALAAVVAVFTLGCSGPGEHANRDSASGPFVTNLIAGAGQGWPVTGEIAGTVSVEQIGTDLVVIYTATGGNTMDVCHLYIGEDAPTTSAPGQFPFQGDALGGTTYTFTLPISGFYPPEGNDPPVAYDWNGDNLYIGAHAETNVYVSGGGGGGGFVTCEGPIGTYAIQAGNSNQGQGTNVGSLSIQVVGTNLVITGTCVSPNTFTETHLYVGLTPPTNHSPGQFPYQHSPLPSGTTTDTYTIPLDQIYDMQGGSPIGADCGDGLYFAWHSTTDPGGQSSSAWNPDCRVLIPGHNWKSYCSFDLECCEEDPGGDPVYREETSWAFDTPGDPDSGVAADEDGWFDIFFNNPNMKWGWFFRFQAD